jgi:hypothetical protein
MEMFSEKCKGVILIIRKCLGITVGTTMLIGQDILRNMNIFGGAGGKYPSHTFFQKYISFLDLFGWCKNVKIKKRRFTIIRKRGSE